MPTLTCRRAAIWPTAAALFATLILCGSVRADGPTDNQSVQVRPMPPPGVELPEATRGKLMEKVKSIREALTESRLDDVSASQIAVIPRAVELAIEQNMFYDEKEFAQAEELLEVAERRVSLVASGSRHADLLAMPNIDADKPQLVVGGYRSRIDGSIQPFGLVIPAGWKRDPAKPLRMDVWLHGRGEKLSEVAFLYQRLNQVGEFSPPDTLVLHPYGRYCNAFKFAGEIDVIEAMEAVQQLYPIDSARIAIRGFSMGGAGCWQMAVHYPRLWAASNPGAGFCETLEFLRVFQKEDFQPTDYQRKLLHWYDCPDWTNNLRNVPTVAYSGEIDNQKQAADVMEAAYQLRGMKLPHVIAPKTAHKILAESKPIIQKQLDEALDAGHPTVPKTIDLTTYMLRYHQLAWLSIEGLEKHWDEAIVHAELGKQDLHIQTKNVSRLKLDFAAKDFPFAADRAVDLEIDSQPLAAQFDLQPESMRYGLSLDKNERGLWQRAVEPEPQSKTLTKRPGLCGPIDDAFMDSFVWVPPNKLDPENPSWYEKEFQHATQEWRKHFRGDLLIKQQISDEDIASSNLILFGTPATNPLIAKVVSSLPIQWTGGVLKVAGTEYDTANAAPMMIYPNPLNPTRYVVINSGFTFREYAYLNNARQIAMLPDWAVVDLTTEPNSVTPGKILQAGFFDEHWQFKQ